MVFPVVMYGCERWTIKKAERQRNDVFELWCWRRLLRVPWTTRRSNQSILKEISPGCSLEGLMLKLKRQYFGHLMQRCHPIISSSVIPSSSCPQSFPASGSFQMSVWVYVSSDYLGPILVESWSMGLNQWKAQWIIFI